MLSLWIPTVMLNLCYKEFGEIKSVKSKPIYTTVIARNNITCLYRYKAIVGSSEQDIRLYG
jgi:hypothetical protein